MSISNSQKSNNVFNDINVQNGESNILLDTNKCNENDMDLNKLPPEIPNVNITAGELPQALSDDEESTDIDEYDISQKL